MKMPDRKVWAGGLAGVVAWAIMFGAGHFGYQIPIEMQPLLVSFVGSVIGYITPASQYDKIKRLNDHLVAIAAADPTIPVSPQN